MAQDLIPPRNSLTRAAEKVQAKRAAERSQTAATAQPTTSAQLRARLNFIPDDSALFEMIDRGLAALSRGIRWTRGSILNLIV